MKHPMQPIYMDGDTPRFKANAIVKALLDTGKLNMNDLISMPFSREDREQFAQLIGYSVAGFGSLPYASDAVVRLADAEAARLMAAPKKKGRP